MHDKNPPGEWLEPTWKILLPSIWDVNDSSHMSENILSFLFHGEHKLFFSVFKKIASIYKET